MTKQSEGNMAAAAIDVHEQAKWDAYQRGVSERIARMPKKDRRDQSRASPQTKWVQEAVTEWFNFGQVGNVSGLGFPSENILYRAGLLIPRGQGVPRTPDLKDVPRKVMDVNTAVGKLLDSRSRVLVGWERHGQYGVDYVARKLRMTPNAVERYLRQARQSIADMMRGMGWEVPQPVESESVL